MNEAAAVYSSTGENGSASACLWAGLDA
jgi:hypothetical protein